MMAEFGRIKIFFLLTPVLQITAAVTGQRSDSSTVRVGDYVTLPCENVINDQNNCDSTTWLFSDSKNAVALFEHGQIHKDAMAKSDRLSVPANCSLVIKKVTVEDAGRYTCRQFISGQQQGPGSLVVLSVITRKDTNVATTIRTVGKNTAVGTIKTESTNNDRARTSQDWWWYVLVALGLAALLIIVVAAVTWRYKANKTRMDDNIALTSNPAVIQSAPKTSQVKADPEDGVSYATISYTKKTNGKGRVQGGDEAVTYSTVRAPSSSAGASADPNNLYATIN